MSIAFFFVILQIVLVPGLIFLNSSLAQTVVGMLAAIILAWTAIAAKSADVRSDLLPLPLAIVIAAPAIGIGIQLVPLPLNLSHPIWSSAASVLSQSTGHITVDVGATISSLAYYLAIAALTLATMLIARDKRHAEFIFWALLFFVTLSILAIFLFGQMDPLSLGNPLLDSIGLLSSTSILGIILACAVALMSDWGPNDDTRLPRGPALVAFLTCIVAGLFGLVGLVATKQLNVGLSATMGLVTILLTAVIRKYSSSALTTTALIGTAVIAAFMLIASRYDSSRAVTLALQFASAQPPENLSIAQRMLSDTGPLGNGAGTYQAVVPFYFRQVTSGPAAPTTAAGLIVQFGWFCLLWCLMLLVLIALLFRGALDRGKDFKFAGAAAACLISVLAETFCDASLLNPGIAVIVAIVVGVGMAQRTSRPRKRSAYRLS